MKSLSYGVAASLMCGVVLGVAPVPAGAEVSFKDKKVTAIIGSRPGDGTDVMLRLLGRMFEKYLSGQPQMIYRSMPAGAGVQALNYFVEKVKPDGMTWAGASGSSLRPELLKKKSVRYDPRELRMFGGLPAPSAMLVIRKDSMDRLNDRSKPALIMGEVKGDRADVVISTHCHNDLGLAVANALAAVEVGARQVEGAINGIGERAGNTSMEEVVMAIKCHKSIDVHTDIVTPRIYNTSRLVSKLMNMPV